MQRLRLQLRRDRIMCVLLLLLALASREWRGPLVRTHVQVA